jgi:hypothetical protein
MTISNYVESQGILTLYTTKESEVSVPVDPGTQTRRSESPIMNIS